MILPIHQRVRARMAEAVQRLYQIPADDPALAMISVETPPKRALGDLAVPLAFELARRLRKAPRVIAQEIVGALGQIDGVSRIEPAPNGYVNFFLERPARLAEWLRPATRRLHRWRKGNRRAHRHQPEQGRTHRTPPKRRARRRIRQAASLPWPLASRSRTTSTTRACRSPTSPSASESSRTRDLDAVKALAESTRFDYYCWDLYAKVTEWYEEDKSRLRIRTAALHDIERGGNPTAAMAQFIADRIVRAHLATMRRLNIGYDLLTWEGDILRLHFWSHAFEFLKRTGAVFLQTEGRLEGCWVMRIDDEDAPDAEPEPESDDSRRAAGKGHRPIRRDRDLRREGHGVSAVEVRPARQGLPLSGLRAGRERTALVDVVRYTRSGGGRA